MSKVPLLLMSLAACTGMMVAPPGTDDPPFAGNDGGTLDDTSDGSGGGSGVVAITNVRVFDGEAVTEGATVVFAGGVITEVTSGEAAPTGAQVIDGTGKTLLPGLIDAHAHTWDDGDLSQAVVLGVTTELDMMGDPVYLVAKRAAEGRGETAQLASLFGAGNPVTVPGGHGTEYGFPVPTLGPTDDAAAFVAARLAEGSDYIKLMHEDGSTYGFQTPTLTVNQLDASVSAAHAAGKLALVHVSSRLRAGQAAASGADGLAHVWAGGADEAVATELARRGQFVVATLSVAFSECDGTRGAALLADPDLDPLLGTAARQILADSYASQGVDLPCEPVTAAVASLRAHGVEILVGTDANNPGVAHGASMHDELLLLVEAGLSPLEALAGATGRTAARFGLSDRGRIAPGKRADLILVDGDPTTRIEQSRRIAGVWKQGVAIERRPPP